MVMSRRVAETQRLDDCCFSRRGTEVQAQRRGGLQGLLCHAKTQRRRDAEIGRCFLHAKAPRCKRKGWQEWLSHAKTQRRRVWVIVVLREEVGKVMSRKGTEVQAQRCGDWMILLHVKTPRCKRKGWQGSLSHAKAQRRRVWMIVVLHEEVGKVMSRKGTEVQAQRRGDWMIVVFLAKTPKCKRKGAEVCKDCYVTQRRKGAKVGQYCCTQRRGGWQGWLCHVKTPRCKRKGWQGSLSHAKAPRCKRRDAEFGRYCHAESQRRKETWMCDGSRKGAEVQAQRRGDNGIKDWEECLGSFFIADNSPCIEYDTKNKDDS
jgi:predicted RNA-binding protein YlqC (UPF0109 family)